MKALTMLAYILALLSPFILIGWFFAARHHERQRNKRNKEPKQTNAPIE